jgi:hypothetical protein
VKSEIDVAPEFLCITFIVWGDTRRNQVATALELENNQ